MILPLAYYGNPILRKKGKKVEQIDDSLRQLVKDMEETMHAHKGIGLAAPQVNHSLALFITSVPSLSDEKEDLWIPGVLHVFINPKLSNPSKELWDYSEGCLSIPTIYEEVSRPWKITIEAMDIEGKTFTQEFSGLEARAIMHENDHINGVLFIDRVHGKKRQALEPLLREVKKKYESNTSV